MRTTLTIDDDVLYAAREIARVEQRTAGEVISDFFRKGIASARLESSLSPCDEKLERLGIQRFGSRGGVVTNEDVNRLREELGI